MLINIVLNRFKWYFCWGWMFQGGEKCSQKILVDDGVLFQPQALTLQSSSAEIKIKYQLEFAPLLLLYLICGLAEKVKTAYHKHITVKNHDFVEIVSWKLTNDLKWDILDIWLAKFLNYDSMTSKMMGRLAIFFTGFLGEAQSPTSTAVIIDWFRLNVFM